MPITLRLAVVPRAFLLLFLLAALMATVITGATIGGRLGLFQAASVVPATGPAGNGLITFDSAGDIWTMRPDGTDRRQLTTSPALEHSPVWSRDGSRLAYWSQEAATTPSSLIVVDANGSDRRTIASDPGGRSPWSLDWSPDGRHVAYSLGSETDPSGERIVVAETDGSGFAEVGDPDLTALKPEWNPDGSKLAFAANRAGLDQGVYLMAPDGTGVRKLSQIVDLDQYAFFTLDWSPDGQTILTNAASQVLAIAADGTGERELTTDVSSALVPTYSPDGERVAFLSLGADTFLVMAADGGAQAELGPGPDGYAWSPDGTAFVVGYSSSRLAVVDAVTGNVLAHIEGLDQQFPAQTHYPSWQRVSP